MERSRRRFVKEQDKKKKKHIFQKKARITKLCITFDIVLGFIFDLSQS